MKYREGYVYQLAATHIEYTGIYGYDVSTDWLRLEDDGKLTIKAGYAWDGCSGSVDTESNMVAGLAHDALYQLMRLDKVSRSERLKVDLFFKFLCLKHGMNRFRAWYHYRGVRNWGKSSTLKKNKQKVIKV